MPQTTQTVMVRSSVPLVGIRGCGEVLAHWFLVKCMLQEYCSYCCSIGQLRLMLCTPMDDSTPGFPVLYHLPELVQTHVIDLVMPSNHLILCHPLLLLPSVFPSIRVFSNKPVLHIRWPKYWNFSFSIGSSNEYSGLISFRMD